MTPHHSSEVIAEGAQQSGQAGASINLTISFMGVIATITGERELTLELGRQQTLRDLLYELERRYGSEFGARIFRNAQPPRRMQMCTRIFINKNLIDETALDQPIPLASKNSPEVLIYFLPAACGG
ncbi:MAG: hypothetical protein EPO23_08740 [Xanthobacteraceae bacterium]|nr:MAG: hypothetical protein EPO23_08740 [Xanthobacteraceae bacterium]